MTKSSCISHLTKQQLVMIRQDYLRICDEDHCAAAILNVLEYWTNIKLAANEQAEIDNAIAKKEGLEASQDTELWIYKSHEEFKTELLNLFGINKIGTAITSLKGKGFLSTRNNPRYGWDRTVQYLFITDTVQKALSSLDLNLTSFKNKASHRTKLKDGSFENNEAIPETTTETTTENPIHASSDADTSKPHSKRYYFEAVGKGAFEVSDFKGLSPASLKRIGLLEKVAKSTITSQFPQIDDEQGALLISKYCAAEKFKPSLQSQTKFELGLKAFLEKNSAHIPAFLSSQSAPAPVTTPDTIEYVDPEMVKAAMMDIQAKWDGNDKRAAS